MKTKIYSSIVVGIVAIAIVVTFGVRAEFSRVNAENIRGDSSLADTQVSAADLATTQTVAQTTDCTLTPAQAYLRLSNNRITVSSVIDSSSNRAVSTISNDTDCNLPISQVTYKMYDGHLETQEFFDYAPGSDTLIVPPRSQKTISTNLPSCMSQTDVYYGVGPRTLYNDNRYKEVTLGWVFNMNSGGVSNSATGNFCTHTPPPVEKGYVKVVKQVINDNGGTKLVGDFKLFVNTIQVTSGQEVTLEPGTYTVSEQNLTGYQAGSWGGDCAASGSVVIHSGDHKTCTITNNDIAVAPTKGYLKVVKRVINDNGGTKQVGDFKLFVNTIQVTSGQEVTLEAATYTVSEVNLFGYQAGSWGGDCSSNGSVVIRPGDHKTCTITNDDIAPTPKAYIKLIKQVINDNGGTKQPNDFALYVGNTRVTNNVEVEMTPGTYTVSEVNLPGYQAGNWTGACSVNGSVTLNNGDHKTCTITNDDIASQPAKGYIKLVKTVINDNGGTKQVNDFHLSVSGTAVTSNQEIQVDPGTYIASEVNLPGYQAGNWGGDCSSNGTVVIRSGDHKTCTITNNDIAVAPTKGYLKLIKYVVNDNNGTKQPNDFALYVGNTRVTNNVEVELSAGTYTASEQNLPGYDAGTWNGACSSNGSVTVRVGEHYTCTITNNDTPPVQTPKAYIKLIKQVINDNGGNKQASDFELYVGSVRVTSGVELQVSPGSYSVSEHNLPGYQAGSWTGDCSSGGNVVLRDGDHKTCTITNNDIPAAKGYIKLIKYVINDNGGTRQVSDFVLHVNNTTVTSGQEIQVDPGTYTASEVNLSGYQAGSWGGDCSANGSVTVDSNEHKTCTITNNDIEQAPVTGTLTLIKQVVNDDGGTRQISDFRLYIDSTVVTSGQHVTLPVGAYTVSEQNLPGYQAGNWTGDCSSDGRVTVTAGTSKTCRIINNDIQTTAPKGCIAIKKEVYDVQGNRMSSFPTFRFRLDGTYLYNNNSSGDVTINNVDFGDHYITEDQTSGWHLDSTVPSNGHVTVDNESNCVTITFKNYQNTTSLNGSCSANVNQVYVGSPVTFSAGSVSGGTGAYTYSWTGDDGLSGSNSSVQKTYTGNGTKNATLTITSGSQHIDVSCSTSVISRPALVVSCAANSNPALVGNTVTFSTSASGGTGAYTYSWTGDDGLSGTDSSVQKSYSNTGTKSAHVTVTSGSDSTVAHCNTVINTPNTQNVSGTCSANINPALIGQTVTYTVNNQSGGNGSYTYSWTGDESLSGTGSSVQKSYSNTGTKNAQVTIYSGNQSAVINCSTQVYQNTNNNFSVSCSPNTSTVFLGNTVTWNAYINSGGAGNYSYYWYGDNNLSGSNSSVTTSYGNIGTRYARIRVTSGSEVREANCQVEVVQQTVCGNCNNGGGVYVSRDNIPGGQVAGVFLSQVPYTGIGNNGKIALFMTGLIGWSAWLAYILVKRKANRYGLTTAGVVSAMSTTEVSSSPENQGGFQAIRDMIRNSIPIMPRMPERAPFAGFVPTVAMPEREAEDAATALEAEAREAKTLVSAAGLLLIVRVARAGNASPVRTLHALISMYKEQKHADGEWLVLSTDKVELSLSGALRA